MLRTAAIVLITCALLGPSYAQAPAAQPANPTAKPAAKKATPKAKVAKPAALTAAETGPCSLGVVSAIGKRFEVDKFGVTVFETEVNEVSIDAWGLDDLVMARVRAAIGGDPGVRKIAVPKDAFELYYHPKSIFSPGPRVTLPGIVRDITANANCQRYLVVTTFNGKIPGTNLELNGIGTYNQGLGSIIRHSHLFANIQISLLDGQSYEKISSFGADVGSRLAEDMRITEDPLKKLDNADFPDPPASASNSTLLRDRIRTLLAAQLDRDLPRYLKAE
jgi:hypothetical protein